MQRGPQQSALVYTELLKALPFEKSRRPLSIDTLSTRNYNRSIGKLTRLGRNRTMHFLIPDSLNSLFLFFFVSSHLSLLSSSITTSIHAPLFYWVQRIGSKCSVPCNKRCSKIIIFYSFIIL